MYKVACNKVEIMKMSELRLLSGLSQHKFSKKYHVNFRTIQNWEQGISEPQEYIIICLYRIISELDFKERFVQDVHSDTYDISGKLFLLKNNHYMLTFFYNNRLECRILEDKKYIVDQFLDDFAWMSLENAYEDLLLNEG